jgi:hypothetical protein
VAVAVVAAATEICTSVKKTGLLAGFFSPGAVMLVDRRASFHQLSLKTYLAKSRKRSKFVLE